MLSTKLPIPNREQLNVLLSKLLEFKESEKVQHAAYEVKFLLQQPPSQKLQ
jgi:hypothetical protein